MKKFRSLLMLVICSALFFSCSEEMFVPPTFESYTSTDSSLKPPSEVSATKGRVGSVELSWNPVPNAVQYLVYSAENEWDDYELFDETADGSCSIEVLQAPGTTMCYKIASVNAAYETSALSKSVRGITLSSPYVTSIESSKHGNSVTIKWYMSEGDKEFEDKIDYTINCYANEKSDSPIKSECNIKETREYTLEGLASGTSYYFEVIAQTSFDNKKYETSGRIYGESAKCILPGPVTDFTVAKGLSTEKVDVSFRVPDFTLYRNSDQTYESMPNFFKIYRRELSAQNFEEIKTITFDEKTYAPETLVEYEDEGTERGKQYEYKVQSFVNARKQITDEKYSVSNVECGWKMGIAKLSQNTDVSYADETETVVSKISVKLELDFDEMGQGYKYRLIEKRYSTANDSLIETRGYEKSFSDLKNEPIVFENLTEEGFYCSYSVEIMPAGSDEVIDVASLLGKILISSRDDVKITCFEVEDGFADRFMLKWDYNEKYSYTILWEDVSENSLAEELDDNVIALTSDMLDLTENGFAKYVHADVESGVSRRYILKASMGVAKEMVSETVRTIGVPAVELNGYSYDSIKLKWNQVSCADTYVVTAKLGDKEIANKNIEASAVSDNLFECELNEFTDYDYADANISGQRISVTVKAINSKKTESNSVESVIGAHTMGPAAVGVEAGQIASRQIRISWNKVDGANYYAIFRKNYDSTDKTEVSSAVKYIYDARKNILSYSGDPVAEDHAKVSADGMKFIFDDKYAVQTGDDDTYGKFQSKIPFGLPYGYVVLPMLNEDDFEFGDDYSVEARKNSRVPEYRNLRETVSSAFGFGLNVKAEKALKSDVQVIRWNEPYVKGQTAYVYTRKTGSGSWKNIGSFNAGYCEYKPEDLYEPYEYAVVYGKMNSMIPSYENYLSDTKDAESPEESLNKGYLLNMKYSAFYNGTKVEGGYKNDGHYYAEKIAWEPWDYSKKKLGPSSIELDIQNANLGGDWYSIARVDSTTECGSAHCTASSLAGTKVIVLDDGVELVPSNMADGWSVNGNGASIGAAEGALKVLRDAKHYYRIKLTSRKLAEDNYVYAYVNNGSYAYRQISDEELAKCAMLAFTYGFYINDGGKEDYSNSSSQFKYGGEHALNTPNGGRASFKGRERYGFGSYIGKYHASCSFNEYAPGMLNPAGSSAQFIKITSVEGSDFEFRIKGDSDNYLYQFVSEPKLKAGFVDPAFPGAEKEIAFTISNANSITLSVNGRQLVSTNDNTTRKQWCPMQVHDNKSYVLHESFYGWWPN